MSAAAPTLVLHQHPLSSYCQKALIALDELGIDAERRFMNPGDPAERAALAALWPTNKIPLLVDNGRPVPESSILIEHLQRHHAAPGRLLIPDDPDAALQVRLWDRLFDQYVMTAMQVLTSDLMRAPTERDAVGTARARAALASAYGWIDAHLAGRTWVAGDAFSLADCAAAPSLFYAMAYVPFADTQSHLAAYFERLLARPSVASAIHGARPWLQYFPGRAGLQRRFFDPDAPAPAT